MRLMPVIRLLGAATLLGCSNPFSGACTLIACLGGLFVQFDRAPDPGTVVTLDIFGAPPWVVRCGQDADCSQGIMFSELRAGYLHVSIATPTDTVVYELRPDYEGHQPNGPGCGPTCYSASVVVALP